MHQGRSNYPKFQIHEKALSTTEMVCGPWKLSGPRKRDQSLFSLLLESRLRREGRNDQIEQLRLSKEKDRQRSNSRDYSLRNQKASAVLKIWWGSICEQYDPE